MTLTLKKYYRNMIKITINEPCEYKLGGTRFGGAPDVPADFIWPTFATETYDDENKEERPLSFLAQFNCEDLAKYDLENELPKTGVLLFFCQRWTECWGFDPKDAGCSRVFWFENVSKLKLAKFPDDLPDEDEFIFPCLKINLTAEKCLPDYEDFRYLCPEFYTNHRDFVDSYQDALKKLNYNWDYEADDYNWDDRISKLLGWADIVQNNMTSECELVNRGYYQGDSEYTKLIPEKELAEINKNAANDWCLLFQFDSLDFDGFELMFGDMGKIFYYIKKEDLKARNFDNAWLILQCG